MTSFNRFRFPKGVACLAHLTDKNQLNIYPLEPVLALKDKKNIEGHPDLDLPENLQGSEIVERKHANFIRKAINTQHKTLKSPTGKPCPKWMVLFDYKPLARYDKKQGFYTEQKVTFNKVRIEKVIARMTPEEWQFLAMYLDFTFDGYDYLLARFEALNPTPDQSEPKQNKRAKKGRGGARKAKLKRKERRKLERERAGQNDTILR